MGTTIYTIDGDWISTPAPYEKVRSWLLENGEPTYIARDHVISFTKF